MHRFVYSLIVLAGMALTAQAGSPSVSISATLGGAPLSASATGTPLQGMGMYGPYPLLITNGTVSSRYVSLVGVVVVGQGIPFRIDADRITGTVRLTYQGAKSLVVLTGIGQVTVN